MNLTKNWMLVGVLTGLLGLVGCGDDDGDPGVDAGPGTDAGMVDGGGEEMDAGEDVDGGGMEDDGETVLSCTATAPAAMGDTCITTAPADPGDEGCPAEPTVVTVDADITADTEWTCANTYILDTTVYVTNDATLTIGPGTVIQGNGGANALVVTTAGRIEAEGTSNDPIVFTSSEDEGSRSPGDWGGLVLLGEAPINAPAGTNNIEGLDPGEARGQYGGDDAAHDCGTLRYVRIEWAGFVFGEDNELNGLTIGGCGTGTTLEFIQVHGGLDDGIEFFGGTANLKYAVVSQVGDDSLDTDEGFIGNVQYFIAQQDAAGNRTIEADNDSDMPDLTPRSAPQIWNATFVGANQEDGQGFRLRRGTGGEIHNAILTGFGMEDCIRVDGTATIEQANSGGLALNASMVDGCRDLDGETSYVRFTADEGDTTEFTGDWCSNNFFGVDAMLNDADNLDDPDFGAPVASPAKGNGATPPDNGFFDTDATWIGAVEPGDCWDWTEGWTAFPAPAE